MTKDIKLKNQVKLTRGANKREIAEFLKDQRLESLDKKIRVLQRQIESLRVRVNKLTDQKVKVWEKYFALADKERAKVKAKESR